MATVIITGASRGIGRATAIELSNKSEVKNIILIASSYDALLETEEKLNPKVNSKVIVFDLMETEKIEGLILDIYEEFGSIDWLLNIAGYTDPELLLDITVDSLVKTYSINVFATIMLTKEVVKYMKENKSSKILNVASTAGSTPRPGWAVYASSKAAIINFSDTLSEELAEYNISVYCVSPGRTATDLRRRLAPKEDPTTIMQPEHVADVISMLMDSKEKSLAGQNIEVRTNMNI